MAALLLAHPGAVHTTKTFLATAGMALAAAALTVLHLRQAPVRVNDWRQAERIVGLAALLTAVGVFSIQRSVRPNEMLGDAFLLISPLVAQAMLVSAILGPIVSLFALTIVAFLIGFSGTMGIDLIAAGWIVGALGVHTVNPLRQRSDILRAASIQSVAMAVTACLTVANRVSTVEPVLESMGWAALAAIAATSVCWLMVAVFERAFGLVSDWSLLELCSPEHPLIRELCLRAPGTYAHSVMVGNLGENAARAIGANPLLVRAMAFFHDVGKVQRPQYFIENQSGENLHEQMPPALSAQVIAAHVRDGLELARKHRVPVAIQDGIAQHHGTSLIAYFWHRAQQQAETMDPEFERLFRYAGPKPQSKETAILHLADQIEAASRTFASTDKSELDLFVARIIENSRAEGQLDECDLTFRELDAVHRSFVETLSILRHERIIYPENAFPNPSSSAPELSRPNREASDPPSSGGNA